MPKKEIDKNKEVEILVSQKKLEKVRVQVLENRISDLTQQQANIQEEIDGLNQRKTLAETELSK